MTQNEIRQAAHASAIAGLASMPALVSLSSATSLQGILGDWALIVLCVLTGVYLVQAWVEP